MSSRIPATRVGSVVKKLNEWQIEGIKEALASLDRGKGERPLPKRSRA